MGVTGSNSIQLPSARAVCLLIAVFLTLIGAAVIIIGERERERALAQLQVRMAGRSSANADILARQLDDLRRDVIFLASVPSVSGVARASAHRGVDTLDGTPLALWEARLTTTFSAYLRANPDVFQVRLIGAAGPGRELIRVERAGGGVPREIAAAQLQEKGASDYMREALRLAPGEVYVSDFNLNREHGQVELPPTATVRAATAVHGDDGKVFAVLVINYDLRAIMGPLRSNLPADFTPYLINARGDFLMHPEVSRAYGFDHGRPWRWQDQLRVAGLPVVGRELRPVGKDGGALYAATGKVSLDLRHPERDLRFVLTVPEQVVAVSVWRAQRDVMVASLLGALAMAATAAALLRQRREVGRYQSHMAAIFENSHDAIIGKTIDGVVTTWNRGAEQMFGYSAAEAVGRPLLALIVPAGAEQEEAEILRRIGAAETVTDLATRRVRKDGSVVDVLVTSSPIRTIDGRVVGVAKTVRDISAQVAATRHINELNARLEEQVRARTTQLEAVTSLQREILAHAAYAVIATDARGLVTLFNPSAESLLGYSADELVGRDTPERWFDAAELADRATTLSLELGRAIAPGFDVLAIKASAGFNDEREWTFIRKDGTRIPVLLSVSALRADDGSISGYLGIAADHTLQKQQQRLLLASRNQLLNAADVAELGIWSWTLADNSLEWNERMYEFYDVPLPRRDSALNYELWRARIHPDDVDMVVAQLSDAVAGLCEYAVVFRVCGDHGRLRHIQANASVERDKHGNAVRLEGINRDISAQYEVEAAMRAAADAADSANRAKSEFLANMSHEIRSPMNAVLGMLTLLKRTALDGRQLDYASKAEGAGRALLSILNDILDFSRIEAGKMVLDPHVFRLDQVMRDISVILAANVGDKDIELLYEFDPDVPDWLYGDSMRIQQVLVNLAGNAVKFTEHGEVAISVKLLPSPAAERHAHAAKPVHLGFSIRDTGIGIAEAQRRKIFEGFSQAEASTARRYGGSGLGLAICQRMVALLGGSLDVDSEVGSGSTFSFDAVCQRVSAAGATLPRGAAIPGLRCLVVDDHGAARESMISMLRTFQWDVEAARSGPQALALLDGDRPFDVMFVDWHMPGMDGWETSVRARRLARPDNALVIIMVTAHGRITSASQQADQQHVLDGAVVKPATASMLFDAVADALSTRKKQGEVVHAAAVRTRQLAGLRLLLVEDNLVNQQVARELLEQEGASVTVAGDGHTAIAAIDAAHVQFDCVLMDIQMPGIDGYAATRKIRSALTMAALPIIAMTANVMESDRIEALAAGMNDHVGKPFDLDGLVDVILRCVTSETLPARHSPIDADLSDPLRRPGFNGAAALARFGGNLRVYGRSLGHFATEVYIWMAAVPAVLGDAPGQETAEALHSLRGLAGTVGADELADAAIAMEGSLTATPAGRHWGIAYAALVAAGKRSAVHAAELAHHIECALPDSQARPPVDVGDLAEVLQKLLALLKSSNLDALPLFDELMCDHNLGSRPEFASLAFAIQQFDFKVAARECDAILATVLVIRA